MSSLSSSRHRLALGVMSSLHLTSTRGVHRNSLSLLRCAAVFLCAALAHAADSAAADSAQQLASEARQASMQSRIDRAIALSRAALAAAPGLPEVVAPPGGASKLDVYMQLSALHRVKGDATGAEAAARAGLALCRPGIACPTPKVAILKLERGSALMELGQTDAANEVLLDVVRLDSRGDVQLVTAIMHAHRTLGEYHQQRSDCEQALVHYQKARDYRPMTRISDLVASLSYLGTVKCEIQLGRFNEARQNASAAWSMVGIDRPGQNAGDAVLARIRVSVAQGEIERQARDFTGALKFFNRAHDLVVAHAVDENTRASVLSGKALVLMALDDEEKAEPLLEQALNGLDAAKRARNRFERAQYAVSLGQVQMRRGKSDAARKTLEYAHAELGKLAPDHPAMIAVLDNLVALALTTADGAHAARWEALAANAEDEALRRTLALGDEEHKLLYLRQFAPNLSRAVSVAVAAPSSDAIGIALDKVLSRRGLVEDVLARSLGSCNEGRGAIDEKCKRYREAVRLYATALYRAVDQIAPAPEAETLELRRKVRLAQEALADPRVGRSHRIKWQDVQRTLPSEAALMEYVVYRPFLSGVGRMWGEPHYGVFVLRRSGDPRFVALGKRSEIDALVRTHRRDLQVPTQTRVTVEGCKEATAEGQATAAQRLTAAVVQPLKASLSGTTELLIVPDGSLQVLPFAALQDETCAHLLSGPWRISYLTSGRDLLSEASRPPTPSEAPMVIVADPAYDAAPANVQRTTAGAQAPSRTATREPFYREPQTLEEARQLKELFPGALSLSAEKATEEALRGLRAPSVLVIASHGTFRSDGLDGAGVGYVPEPAERSSTSPRRGPLETEHPLLRSGIALAGANVPAEQDGDDGLLTALEASTLNLVGTQLVVLSACHTGEGEQIASEGLYGLQRAFRLAGAASELVTLWRVNGAVTADLVVDFFKRVRAGDPRSAALVDAQRAVAGKPGTGHPMYWAAMVLVGDRGPLRLAD